MAAAIHSIWIRFSENANKYKDFEAQQNFSLVEKDISWSWNQSKMTKTVNLMVKWLKKKYVINLTKMQKLGWFTKCQHVITEKFKMNIIDDASTNDVKETINQSIKNCVQFAKSLARICQNQSKKRSRNRFKNSS